MGDIYAMIIRYISPEDGVHPLHSIKAVLSMVISILQQKYVPATINGDVGLVSPM